MPLTEDFPGPAPRQSVDTLTETGPGNGFGAKMIVVMHRGRSEKLAQRFHWAMMEQQACEDAWSDLTELQRETVVASFDSLIQDGLISEHQHRPEGRE